MEAELQRLSDLDQQIATLLAEDDIHTEDILQLVDNREQLLHSLLGYLAEHPELAKSDLWLKAIGNTQQLVEQMQLKTAAMGQTLHKYRHGNKSVQQYKSFYKRKTMRGSLQAYKKVSVDSQLSAASPHKIVQMLMAGAIERLIQGKAAMQQGNIPVKGERLGKALDIIISLRSCLSMEDGGDIAKNLDQLYDFMVNQITQANHKNDPQMLDDVIEIIREIKSAWDQIPPEYHNLTAAEVGI